jgi:UPF0271 protein
MVDQVYVLDASGIIGGFYSKKSLNFITSQVIREIKDLKSEMTLQSAIDDGNVRIKEPDIEDIKQVEKVIRKSGDISRLSQVDRDVVALGLTLRRNNLSPTVVTDDYSMQNVLKIMGIPYRGVLTRGIEYVVEWVKVCKGCKKKYPKDHASSECEICGSPIIRKRVKR